MNKKIVWDNFTVNVYITKNLTVGKVNVKWILYLNFIGKNCESPVNWT